jgi:hypothetical protein
MKSKLSLLLLIALIFNLSCKKNKIIDVNNDCPPLILLTKVTGSRIGTNGILQAVNMNFIYNIENSLVKIKDGSISLSIEHDDFAVFKVQYTDSTTITPKRKVVLLQSSSPPDRPITEEQSIFEGDKLISKSLVQYSYTDESSMVIKHTESTGAILLEKYTFSQGNISSFDNGKGTIYTYKYGKKLNPYADRLLKYRMGLLDFTSINEVTEIEENTNGSKTVTRNTYTYNKDGFPVTLKTINSLGITTQEYKFEYGRFSYGCY